MKNTVKSSNSNHIEKNERAFGQDYEADMTEYIEIRKHLMVGISQHEVKEYYLSRQSLIEQYYDKETYMTWRLLAGMDYHNLLDDIEL